MAIRVEHQVGGKVSGDVAFETGKGQRRERDLRVAQQRADNLRREQLAENARKEAIELRKQETARLREDRMAEAERAREFATERDVYQRAGRVEDLQFGRDTGTLAAQAAEERRAREFALAAKHQADGDERQYTVEQQRKKDAINSSRVKIEEGVANGTYTEFQAEQFHQELDAQELGISKMWGPKKVTPQDELLSRTFTADNGQLMYIDGAGKVQAYPGQLSPQEKLEATEKQRTQEYEWEMDRKKVAFEQKQARTEYIAKRVDAGATVQEAITQWDTINPQPTLSAEDAEVQMAEEISRQTGKPLEQVYADIDAAKLSGQATGQGGVPQQADIQPIAGNVFEENTPENQELIMDFFEKREAGRQKPREKVTPFSAPFSPSGAAPVEEKFGEQTLSQFLSEFDSNPNLRQEVQAEIVKTKIKDMSTADWRQAYGEYKSQNAGKRLEFATQNAFKTIMKKNAGELSNYFSF